VLHICDRNKTELPVNSDYLGTKCVGTKLKKCIPFKWTPRYNKQWDYIRGTQKLAL